MSWQEKLRNVEPYQAGEQPKIKNLIKLNTNENPYHPGEKVISAISDFDAAILSLYPNPDADDLKHSLAQYHEMCIRDRTPTIHIISNGKFIKTYQYLDEDYIEIKDREKQKAKRQEFLDQFQVFMDDYFKEDL